MGAKAFSLGIPAERSDAQSISQALGSDGMEGIQTRESTYSWQKSNVGSVCDEEGCGAEAHLLQNRGH